MGRSQKNKRKHQAQNQAQSQNNKKGKRPRHERFWIEDCHDTKVKEGETCQMEVLITRVELTDDYRQISKQSSPSDTQLKDTSSPNILNSSENRTKKPNEEPSPAKIPTEDDKAEEIQPLKGKNGDMKIVPAEVKDTVDKSATESDKVDAPTEDPISQKALIRIKRSKGAKRPIKRVFDSVENFKPLPNGDCGDGVVNPHPKEEVPDKFWSQRRRLFTRFDEGIQLDKESWYSVTPEAIANHIASHLVGGKEEITVLDPFCGCGGNAIAFALRSEVRLVVAVDKDLQKLKKAASNAKIYGVPPGKLVFIHDNACRILRYHGTGKLKAEDETTAPIKANKDGYDIGGVELLPKSVDAIFLSPPWGGMDYAKVGKRNYDLSCINIETDEMIQMDGDELLEAAATFSGCKPVALFMPRNTNGVALGRSAFNAGYSGPIVMEQNVLNGKLKTVTAYFGL